MNQSIEPTNHDEAQTTLCDEEKYKPYSDINDESNSTNLGSFSHYLPRSRFHCLLTILLIFLLLIPFLYYAVSRPQKHKQCGTTAEEARARGCVFETTGFTWLPRECHDPDTEKEFLEFITTHELFLYRDSNYTDVVPMEEVRRGNGPGFFVRQAYHKTHCLFLLKKLHRTLARGTPLDGQIMPTHHTEHCVEQALKPPGFREHAVQLSYTKFPYCGKPGGFNVGWKIGVGLLGWTDD